VEISNRAAGDPAGCFSLAACGSSRPAQLLPTIPVALGQQGNLLYCMKVQAAEQLRPASKATKQGLWLQAGGH
jgi:hypothetical protein